MEMEQALETQRAKLLRLLAGWFSLLEWLSFGPFQIELPRWVRVFFADLVIRAEFAAQSLIVVSARLSAKNSLDGSSPTVHALQPLAKVVESADDVPSTATLLQRIKALRAALENLPHQRVRPLRHRTKRQVASCRCKPNDPFVAEGWGLHDLALVRPRIERPPDRQVHSALAKRHLIASPRIRAEAVGAYAASIGRLFEHASYRASRP